MLPPRAAPKANRAPAMVPTAGDWLRDPAPRPGRVPGLFYHGDCPTVLDAVLGFLFDPACPDRGLGD